MKRLFTLMALGAVFGNAVLAQEPNTTAVVEKDGRLTAA